jgi:hypothetical protein
MNCRGVGKKGFSFCLRDLIYEFDFEFTGLQETMKILIDISILRKFDVDSAYNWLWSPSVRCSRGILCGIKSSKFNVSSILVEKIC